MWPFSRKAKAQPETTLREPNFVKQVAPLLVSSSASGQKQWHNWNTETAVKEGFKASTWVYDCCRALMDNASSVKWYPKELQGDDWAKIEGEHQLKALIERPNAYFSQQRLIETMVAHLYLGGNAILKKVVVRGTEVAELWVLPPQRVYPVPHSTLYLEKYVYVLDGAETDIKPEEIIHVQFPDPSNEFWGISPLMAGARAVDTDIAAVEFNFYSLKNRGVFDAMFTIDGMVSDAQWNKNEEMIKNTYCGPENSRKAMLLSGIDTKFQQLSISPAEMDFLNSRRWSANEICALYRVPPIIIGLYDEATYSNAQIARAIFWLDTIIPLLRRLRDAFNWSLVWPHYGKGYELDFDLSSVQALRSVFADQVGAAMQLWQMGVPFNEINRKLELGFADIDGGDVGYLSSALSPAGAIGGEVNEGL